MLHVGVSFAVNVFAIVALHPNFFCKPCNHGQRHKYDRRYVSRYKRRISLRNYKRRLLSNGFGLISYIIPVFDVFFYVTAMGVDIFVSIAYPYKYLDFISNKKGRIIGVCVLLWTIALLVVVCHDIVNSSRLFYCAIGSEIGEEFLLGIQNSNLRVIGVINICILITNLATYIAILVKIWKQPSEVRNQENSALRKILAFAVTYAFLHGPFNITTALVGVFNDGLAPPRQSFKLY